MKRGEVWWHEPPDSKRRPVLILTRDGVAAQSFDLTAMPATSIARGPDTEVRVGVADGMPIECVLNPIVRRLCSRR